MFATRFVRRLVRIAGIGREAPRPGWGRLHFVLRCSPIAIFAVPVAAQPTCYYTYTPIPPPPGWLGVAAYSINNRGEVAGVAGGTGDTTRTFVWSPEAGTRLMPFPPGIINMVSAYINDFGVVAGAMHSSTTWYGYVWDGASYTTIPLPAWANSIYVRGINNAGQVVGTVHGGGPFTAFIWQNGVMTELTSALGRNGTFGEGVNSVGAIGGYAGGWNGDAFVLNDSDVNWLAEPSGQGMEALALSNNGFAAGKNTPFSPNNANFRYLGVVWSPNGDFSIITPPGATRDALMYGVNSMGRAVGYYYRGGMNGAIVWQSGGATKLSLLVDPPISWRILYARDINEVGQIAVGTDQGAAVLTPNWLAGDLTGDCHVSLEDLMLVLANFGAAAGTYPLGDVDLDGDVDLTDLATLLVHFGQ